MYIVIDYQHLHVMLTLWLQNAWCYVSIDKNKLKKTTNSSRSVLMPMQYIPQHNNKISLKN